MATILGLALKINADASGVPAALTPVEKALQGLDREAAKVTGVFDRFSQSSAAAAEVQQRFQAEIDALTRALEDRAINGQQFADGFAAIRAEAAALADTFAEGARITDTNRTAEDRRVETIGRLNDLLQAGAIDARNFGLEAAKVSEGFSGTAVERFAEAVAPLRVAFEGGAISAEAFAQQSREIAAAINDSTPAAERQSAAILQLRDRYQAGRISVEQYREEFSRIQSGDIATTFEVQVVGVREGVEASNELRASLAQLTDTQITAALEVAGVEKLDDLRAQFAGIDGSQIDALLRVLGVETIEAARQQLAIVDGTEIDAQLQVLGIESIEQARTLLAGVEGKNIDVIAETLGFDSVEQLKQAIDAAESKTVTFDVAGNADEEAKRVAELVAEQNAYVESEKQRQALLEEGKRVTEANRTSEEKRAAELQRLQRLLDANAISEETYARAKAEASGANAAAAQAERERADISARAARVLEQNLTASERAQNAYNAEIAEYQTLLRAGAISQEDFNKAVDRSAQSFAKATIEAGKTGTAIDAAGKGGTLQFNELSGILSALPGPLGNVAGRFSGLASAGEGLSRVFSGGLSAGISGVGASVAGLINPFTAAVAGVAAFGAGALAVTRGLTQLEDRVENLGNIADKLGVSFEFIQTLEEAANRSGTSIDAVSAAFGRLQKSVLGVDEESKAAQKALSEIGVTAEELQQLSPEQQYERIGVALAGIEDPARRTATATALFGRAGADLIPFFNNLPGATADIERFGRSLTAIDRRRIDEFGAGLDALGVATQGLGQSLLLPFVGLGEGVATAFAEITAGVTAVIDPIGQILEPVLTQIGRVIQLIGTGVGNLGRIIGAVFEPFATVVQTVSQALEPLYDGLFGFLEGFSDAGVQVTQFLVSFTPIGAIAENAAVLGDTLSRVVTIVTTAFSRIGEVIGNTLGQAVDWVSRGVSVFVEFTGLGPTLEAIGSTISSVFGAVSSVFQTIASAIGGTVGRLLTIAENFLGIERSAEAASTGVDQVTESTAQLTEEQKRAAGEVQKAVENSSGVLDTAIKKAGEFGQAGFEAALQFQEALADLKEQADANELNAEQYSRGVALATAEFDKQIERLQKIQDETRKATEEAQKRVDADRQVADALLEQARINSQFGGDASRARAADAVLAVEREIARLQEQVAADRDAGNTEAVAAGEERIRQLTLIAQQQGAIADGSAKAAADEAKRVEDQKKRVDALIAASDTRSELEQQLIDVQEQQKLTLDQLIIARQTFNREQADAAAGRLAQLDQLQAKLEDQQQAVEQGFGEGFAQAFQETDRGIDDLIVRAQEFGNVGALAAQALEQGIAQAQAQASAGILTRETYEREVAQQRDIFEQRLQAANRVEEFLRNGVDARQQAELKATEELEKRKKEAAVNVQAIEAKLIEQRKQLEELREKGDIRGARAAQTRVAALERAQREEQALADGRLRQQNQIGQQFLTGLNSAQQFQSLVTQSNDNFLKAFNNTYAGANAALAANAAAAQEQAAKLERLLTPTNQLASTADIRTQEGQQLLLDVAATGVDPRLVEARLQTKQLNLIAQGISQAAANYFNTPVAIVGGAVLG